MGDFNIRSDSVDVEQIMKQIRARIQEKRGVDYTEEQVRELATVRLEKFLDPKNLRSDLLEQFRLSRPALPEIPKESPPVEAPYEFDDQTLFASHRGSLRFVRKLLKPVLKLFFNPNTLNQLLHAQAQFNVDMIKRDQRRKIEMQMFDRTRAEWNVLYYEVLHNLVLETTRNGIELKNLRMRVEALASRLDFSERRVRALEGVVQYRPEVVRHHSQSRRSPESGPASREDWSQRSVQGPIEDATEDGSITAGGNDGAAGAATRVTPGEGRRRRRRRRGRRPTGIAGALADEQQTTGEGAIVDESPNEIDDMGGDDSETDSTGDSEPQ
jgi:hypothetical protein